MALVNRLTAQTSTPSYDTLAPFGTPFPYIVVQYISGGYDPQTALDTRSELWQVKAVSDNHATAQTIADAIHSALHRHDLTISGWQTLHMLQTESIWQVEPAQTQPIYHAGGLFRIQLARQP